MPVIIRDFKFTGDKYTLTVGNDGVPRIGIWVIETGLYPAFDRYLSGVMAEWRELCAKEATNYNSLQFARRQRDERNAELVTWANDALRDYCERLYAKRGAHPGLTSPTYHEPRQETQWHEYCTPVIPARDVVVRNRVGVHAIMRTCPVGCMWADMPK
jgi:hypothetical protein